MTTREVAEKARSTRVIQPGIKLNFLRIGVKVRKEFER